MAVDYTLPKSELPAPIRVSPFIRFCRWSLLIAGVAYGMKHHRTLAERERLHRIKLREQKLIWDEEQRILANRRTREQLLSLAKEINVPIPDDFDKQYPPV
ncbi:Hydrogen ion transmembrane transporter [Dermatophagoides pteronyssinus]|uniref:ATP synthase F(0) complex subunit e, mitochondrial n=2 Tax=Dermatophagoides pteronyssinus TaxID=6956 RepID=A0A6P6YGW2_DERPT|nr:ATP synthase subunit e, mitochondrial-like [Dermatophagoides pteronyssinus]KAH9416836.1 Hydrogen ion transmembrane transporter [Dermatophagoides pteronyssinus]